MITHIMRVAKQHETVVRVHAGWRTACARLAFVRSIPRRDLLDVRKIRLMLSVRLKPYTMLSYPRLANLYEVASVLEREGIEGSLVQCGVWNGGSAGLIATVSPNRELWLFDSWEGMPEPSAFDVSSIGRQGTKGEALGSEHRVEQVLFRKLRLNREKVHMVKGWFQDTIPVHKARIGKIALLHIDADWYESVRLCLERLYNNVVPGGFVVIDDYGYWQGCDKAVHEFLEKRKLTVDLKKIVYAGKDGLAYEGAYFRKTTRIDPVASAAPGPITSLSALP